MKPCVLDITLAVHHCQFSPIFFVEINLFHFYSYEDSFGKYYFVKISYISSGFLVICLEFTKTKTPNFKKTLFLYQ